MRYAELTNAVILEAIDPALMKRAEAAFGKIQTAQRVTKRPGILSRIKGLFSGKSSTPAPMKPPFDMKNYEDSMAKKASQLKFDDLLKQRRK
jgi:hypothetical protein